MKHECSRFRTLGLPSSSDRFGAQTDDDVFNNDVISTMTYFSWISFYNRMLATLFLLHIVDLEIYLVLLLWTMYNMPLR